jgi:hypothetical protein
MVEISPFNFWGQFHLSSSAHFQKELSHKLTKTCNYFLTITDMQKVKSTVKSGLESDNRLVILLPVWGTSSGQIRFAVVFFPYSNVSNLTTTC